MTEPDDPFAVLTTPPPAFSPDDVDGLLEDRFGLRGNLTSLDSERDQNFRLDTPAGQRYVVKIANAAEPRAVTEFQASALRHLAETEPAFPSPRIRPTRGGETSVAIEDAQGRAHRLRVMSWLDGAMMADGNPGSLAASMGRCLARLDSALADFAHPGDTYTLPWDISNAQLAAAKAGMIDDASLRRVCERHFEHFRSAIAPSLGELRRQVIHNDFNPGNVLVDPTDHGRIVGIIDFGDMLRAPLVVDVATAATYLAIGHPDPRSEIDRFLSTYEQSIPLTEQELALIDDLIVTRLVVSITIGHWRAQQFPDNRRYIMVTQKRTIALLRQMTGE